MSIATYFISPSVAQHKQSIRKLIYAINPSLIEVSHASSDTVTICTQSEVFMRFGTSRYYATSKFIEETKQLNIGRLPLSLDRRQFTSLCLASQIVTIVGFDQNEFSQILKYVFLLGATFSKTLDDSVTLVITKTVLSRRIEEARRLGISIVSKDWIVNCYQKSSFLPIDSFKIDLFHGLRATSSELSSSERKKLKEAFEENGGIWSEVLDVKTDILFTPLLMMTNKVKVALKSNLPIVRPSFVYESVESKGRALTRDYVINWWSDINAERTKLFNNLAFCLLTPDDLLPPAIVANGGMVVQNPERANILVVGIQNHQELSNIDNDKVVTDLWVWRSIESGNILDKTASMLFRPLKFSVPIQSFTDISVAIIGLADEQRCDLYDAVKVLGGIPTSRLHKSVKIALIGKAIKNEKIDKLRAKFSAVTFLNPLFIRDILTSGNIPDLGLYTVGSELKQKIANVCHSILSISRNDKFDIFKNKKQSPISDELISDASEAEPEVYLAKPFHRLRPLARHDSYDPLLEALSSSDEE